MNILLFFSLLIASSLANLEIDITLNCSSGNRLNGNIPLEECE